MPSFWTRRPQPPVHHYPLRYLLVVPVLLAIATVVVLFVHSDVNMAMLYSQCHARSRLPFLSRLPVIGAPACFLVSFFQVAVDSVRSAAVVAAALAFIGGLLTVSTVEAARVCNAPNVLIAYPTGAWLVFNLVGGAVVWELVIIPAFLHRARSVVAARAGAAIDPGAPGVPAPARDPEEGGVVGAASVTAAETDELHPSLGRYMRHLTVDAEIVAIPASVAIGFVLPSVLMLVLDTPGAVLAWLFFPVYVSAVRQAVRYLVLRLERREHHSLHLESHPVYLGIVYGLPVVCSAVAHAILLWALLARPDDRREMTRATVRFIEIDVGFIVLTVLYWLFVEAGWRTVLVVLAASVFFGPGAGLCIGWIYREAVLYHGITEVDDETEAPESADEETPLLA